MDLNKQIEEAKNQLSALQVRQEKEKDLPLGTCVRIGGVIYVLASCEMSKAVLVDPISGRRYGTAYRESYNSSLSACCVARRDLVGRLGGCESIDNPYGEVK